MIERRVFQTRKGADGSVVAVGHRGAPWSPRPVELVAEDIASGRVVYLVPWARAEVRVALDPGGKGVDAPGPDGLPGGLRQLPDL